MIADDEVVVMRDTMDVSESPHKLGQVVARGQFGRVLTVGGAYVKLALDAVDEPQVVVVRRDDVEDRGQWSVRQGISRR